jgi:hypothetical protein
MAKVIKNNAIGHAINVILILAVSYLSVYLMLIYKSVKISKFVVPLLDGKPDYSDLGIEKWLNSFDTLVYILAGIVLLAVIIRYVIENIVITHDKTVFRTLVFLAAVVILELSSLIYFFKVKAPILEGDTQIILTGMVGSVLLFYVLAVAFVPSCIKYLIFPRNLFVKK